jgi:triphosphatase
MRGSRRPSRASATARSCSTSSPGPRPAPGAGRRIPPCGIGSTRPSARKRRVRRKGRGLADLPPEARHRVRIAAKKLRYASEFFAALVEGKKAGKRHKRFLARLETLQEVLGELNDIETGRTLATAHPGAGRDPTLPPPDPAHEARLVADAAKAHRKFRKAEPFWTKFA